MTAEQLSVLAVLVTALGFFIWGRWRFDLVAMSALLVLTLAGIVPAAEAFAGFGHPAVITVASVLMIGAALKHSGVLEWGARQVSRATRHSSGQVMLLTGLVAVCSAIMNNVAALALLMPVAVRSAEAARRPVSQVLMPLSFASLLGGLTTLMGTPPNIIIASYRAETAGEPFSVFDFSPVGLGVALVGIIFISIAGWRLIPRRRQTEAGSEGLFEISDYVTEARLPENSPLVGQTLGEIARRASIDLRVVALVRRGRRTLAPELSAQLQAGDVLVLEGDPKALQAVATDGALEIMNGEGVIRNALQSENLALVEAVISPSSTLEDRPASRARFRRLHGAQLLAVSRQGRPLWRGLRDIRLRVGDVLLLYGHKDTLPEVLANLGCLPLAERDLLAAVQRPSLIPIGLFATGIAAASLGLVPVDVAFATTAVVLVILNYLPVRDVYSSVDWPVIVLVAALLPVGQAFETTGGTDVLARFVADALGGLSPLPLIAILIATSMMVSDVINNAAAAIVMAPLAVTVATDLGVPTDSLLMAVAVGCSSTFLTPIGHQSNTLVMGPGGYRFGDYWRLGLPLDLLIIATGSLLISVVWA